MNLRTFGIIGFLALVSAAEAEDKGAAIPLKHATFAVG